MVENPGFWSIYFVIPVLNGLLLFYWIFNSLGLPGALGLGIIAFVISVRLILHPFFKKTIETQKAMQMLQPQLENLKKKYAKDPQKLQQEQIALYQKAGINPASGCLVMIAQIALFISLYSALNFLLHSHLVPIEKTVAENTKTSQQKVREVWKTSLISTKSKIQDLSGESRKILASTGQIMGSMLDELIHFYLQTSQIKPLKISREEFRKIGQELNHIVVSDTSKGNLLENLAEKTKIDQAKIQILFDNLFNKYKPTEEEYTRFFNESLHKLAYVPSFVSSNINYNFLGYDLSLTPHQGGNLWYLLIPIITALLQLAQAHVMPQVKLNNQDKKKDGAPDMGFQKALNIQMKYFFPVLLGFIAYNLPLGLALYWNVNSLFSIIQYQGEKIWKILQLLKPKQSKLSA